LTAPLDEFVALANLLPEPTLLVWADGRVKAANRAFRSTFAITNAPLPGQTLSDLARPSSESIDELLHRFARTGQLVAGALMISGADGATVPCKCEGAALVPATASTPALLVVRLTPKTVATSQFVALTQKIDQLGAEVARRLVAEQQVTKERELLEVTLASIGDAVITTDTAARVTFMNRVAETLTGWALGDALGRPIDEVFHIVNEDTREAVANPVARVLREGTTVGLANHTVLIARDGIERPIDDSGAPISDTDGHVHGAVLVFRDVTELRRAEREQVAARVVAENASRTKDQFLATLSHELRTPLNVILGWVRMLRNASTERPSRRGLEVIEHNAAALARLVDDLLDLSRITTGKLSLRYEPVDLAEVVAVEVESIRPGAHKKGLRVVSNIVAPARVNGDPERLHQVLWNLLSNAVKFTPTGGEVSVELTLDGELAAIRVRDTGEGFSPDLKTRIFEAFVQADGSPTRPHGGLGLGLAVAKHLVAAHNGSIDAHSDGPTRGAMFEVKLPALMAGCGDDPPA
jgi:PAS domain S-box-containing protein